MKTIPLTQGKVAVVDDKDFEWLKQCIATPSQNMANRGIGSNNQSGVKGCHWDKRCKNWHAKIQVNRRSIHRGRFSRIEDTAETYAHAAKHYFGEFARAALSLKELSGGADERAAP